MPGLRVKDAVGATRTLKQTGAGTDGDPFVRNVIIDGGTIAALDIALSALRDAIVKTGGTSKTLADLYAAITGSLTISGTVTDSSVAALTKGAGNVDATTLRVITAADGPINQILGIISGSAVTTDANGTLQQYLRGLVKLWIAGLVAGEAHIGSVGGATPTRSNEFTRPADGTAYAVGDVVSNSTSSTTPLQIANCARLNGGSGYITGIRITTNKKSITPKLRVHVFNATGATLAADNVAYKEVYADASKRVGFYDMPAMTTENDTTNSDMSFVEDFTMRIPYMCAVADTSLYVVLKTLDAFTPDSAQKFNVALNTEQN